MSLCFNSEELQVNVDTIEGAITGMTFDLPMSDQVVVYDQFRDKKAVYGNRIKVKGRRGVHSLHYRAINSDSLHFEGSVYGCKYGQNVFTLSDVGLACRMAIKRIIKHSNLDVEEELKNCWLGGDIDLTRVDLAVNYRLSSSTDVDRVLRQLRRQLIEQHGPTHTYQNSVCWAPQGGKQYSIVVYAKGKQLQATMCRGKDSPPYMERLAKECENILRIEVRLRAGELRKLNLSKARDWNENAVRSTFIKYAERLKLFNVTAGVLDKSELEDLPSRLRPVLALHKLGAELNEIYSDRTCQRHRDAFRGKNIDLRCPNQKESEVVMLMDYLSPEKQIKEAPAWMIKKKIAPDNSQHSDSSISRKRKKVDAGVLKRKSDEPHAFRRSSS